jgi:hypothetical protein
MLKIGTNARARIAVTNQCKLCIAVVASEPKATLRLSFEHSVMAVAHNKLLQKEAGMRKGDDTTANPPMFFWNAPGP